MASCHSAMEEAISVARKIEQRSRVGCGTTSCSGARLHGTPSGWRGSLGIGVTRGGNASQYHAFSSARNCFTWGGRESDPVARLKASLAFDDGIRVVGGFFQIMRRPSGSPLKAEALYLAERTFEAVEVIKEELLEVAEARWWCAEMHRLRGIFSRLLRAEDNSEI